MMSVVRGFCDDDDDATIEFCWSFVLHRSLTMSTWKTNRNQRDALRRLTFDNRNEIELEF